MKPRPLHTLMIVALVVLAGCTTPSPTTTPPTATPVPPTATPLPPTETRASEAAPTATPVPPTFTPIPPTPTPLPPTDTPIPPTSTPIPPTPTPLPPTDTVCASGCDFVTIQAAINNAGTEAEAIIEVTDPIHTEAGIVVNGGITITIRGLGAAETVVQAHETLDEAPERVFLVEAGATVTLEKMTIRHGKPSVEDECGGGIVNYGTLTLGSCSVTDSTANGGAGVCNSGALTVVNSTVSNNVAHEKAPRGLECGCGGGIKSGGESLVLINSTISGNQAGSGGLGRNRGGGVHVGCGCTAVFTNSTISGNRAAHQGGGVYLAGTLRLVNCTITNNRASDKGGGIHILGHLDYENTIIAYNTGRGGDCTLGATADNTKKGTIGINSNNLVENGRCGADFSGDPMLGGLANNGGETKTHALLAGSPAIDAIPVVSCTLPIDQRWMERPVAAGEDTPLCDIGAFEWQSTLP